MKIGIGGVSLEPCFGGKWRMADELKACALAAEGASGECGVIVVADVVRLRLDFATQVREAVARELGLGIERVCVSATQNHSAFEPMDSVKLERAFVEAAREAWEGRTEAEMAGVAVCPEPPLNHCRRMTVPGLGAFTCWYGHVAAEGGRAEVSYLIELAKEALARGELDVPRATSVAVKDRVLRPGSERYFLPASDDPLVQGLFFRRPGGEAIGAMLRFTGHPATGGRAEGFRTGDFPVYARRRLAEVFGGKAFYLAGPCGDTVPLIEEKSLGLSERLGRALADAALGAVKGASWSARGDVASATTDVELMFREDLPRELERGKAEVAEVEGRIRETASRGDLAGVKRLQERRETLLYWCGDTLGRWTPVAREAMAGARVKYPLFAMRLGEHGILGLPGEPYAAYSARIRAMGAGGKLLVGEQCNSGFGYIPTAGEFELGGYGPSASLFDGRVEGMLLEGARRGLAAVGLGE